MKNLIIICTVLFLGFMFQSCSPEEVVLSADAELTWSGSYELDGCGYFLKIDGVDYKASNEDVISDVYMTSSPATVNLEYILLPNATWNCFAPTEDAGMIEIVSITE